MKSCNISSTIGGFVVGIEKCLWCTKLSSAYSIKVRASGNISRFVHEDNLDIK